MRQVEYTPTVRKHRASARYDECQRE